MTDRQITELIRDYDGGYGPNNLSLAQKHKVSKTTVINTLTQAGVYKRQRKSHKDIGDDGSLKKSDWVYLLKEEIKRKDEALKAISEWVLPVTGKFWDKENKEPMSFRAVHGVNDEIQYIRNIAFEALNIKK